MKKWFRKLFKEKYQVLKLVETSNGLDLVIIFGRYKNIIFDIKEMTYNNGILMDLSILKRDVILIPLEEGDYYEELKEFLIKFLKENNL
jgi:phosphopantothenate synthetase